MNVLAAVNIVSGLVVSQKAYVVEFLIHVFHVYDVGAYCCCCVNCLL